VPEIYQRTSPDKSKSLVKTAGEFVWQADEEAFRPDVAAGLSCQISIDSSDRWRRKAAVTPFFISLPVKITIPVRFSHFHLWRFLWLWYKHPK
jgi:hypothetical protein